MTIEAFGIQIGAATILYTLHHLRIVEVLMGALRAFGGEMLVSFVSSHPLDLGTAETWAVIVGGQHNSRS